MVKRKGGDREWRQLEDEDAPIGVRKEYTFVIDEMPANGTCLARQVRKAELTRLA